MSSCVLVLLCSDAEELAHVDVGLRGDVLPTAPVPNRDPGRLVRDPSLLHEDVQQDLGDQGRLGLLHEDLQQDQRDQGRLALLHEDVQQDLGDQGGT